MDELVTPRTTMRPFALTDTPLAHAVFADAEVMRYSAGGPDPDMDATQRRLQAHIESQSKLGYSKWAVFAKGTDTYLGDAGLTHLEETGEVELGFRLAQQVWGVGLGTEIAKAWLAHAFGPLGLQRVIAFSDPANGASIRVMEKMGMTFARSDKLCGMDCVVYEASPAMSGETYMQFD